MATMAFFFVLLPVILFAIVATIISVAAYKRRRHGLDRDTYNELPRTDLDLPASRIV